MTQTYSLYLAGYPELILDILDELEISDVISSERVFSTSTSISSISSFCSGSSSFFYDPNDIISTSESGIDLDFVKEDKEFLVNTLRILLYYSCDEKLLHRILNTPKYLPLLYHLVHNAPVFSEKLAIFSGNTHFLSLNGLKLDMSEGIIFQFDLLLQFFEPCPIQIIEFPDIFMLFLQQHEVDVFLPSSNESFSCPIRKDVQNQFFSFSVHILPPHSKSQSVVCYFNREPICNFEIPSNVLPVSVEEAYFMRQQPLTTAQCMLRGMKIATEGHFTFNNYKNTVYEFTPDTQFADTKSNYIYRQFSNFKRTLNTCDGLPHLLFILTAPSYNFDFGVVGDRSKSASKEQKLTQSETEKIKIMDLISDMLRDDAAMQKAFLELNGLEILANYLSEIHNYFFTEKFYLSLDSLRISIQRNRDFIERLMTTIDLSYDVIWRQCTESVHEVVFGKWVILSQKYPSIFFKYVDFSLLLRIFRDRLAAKSPIPRSSNFLQLCEEAASYSFTEGDMEHMFCTLSAVRDSESGLVSLLSVISKVANAVEDRELAEQITLRVVQVDWIVNNKSPRVVLGLITNFIRPGTLVFERIIRSYTLLCSNRSQSLNDKELQVFHEYLSNHVVQANTQRGTAPNSPSPLSTVSTVSVHNTPERHHSSTILSPRGSHSPQLRRDHSAIIDFDATQNSSESSILSMCSIQNTHCSDCVAIQSPRRIRASSNVEDSGTNSLGSQIICSLSNPQLDQFQSLQKQLESQENVKVLVPFCFACALFSSRSQLLLSQQRQIAFLILNSDSQDFTVMLLVLLIIQKGKEFFNILSLLLQKRQSLLPQVLALFDVLAAYLSKNYREYQVKVIDVCLTAAKNKTQDETVDDTLDAVLRFMFFRPAVKSGKYDLSLFIKKATKSLKVPAYNYKVLIDSTTGEWLDFGIARRVVLDFHTILKDHPKFGMYFTLLTKFLVRYNQMAVKLLESVGITYDNKYSFSNKENFIQFTNDVELFIQENSMKKRYYFHNEKAISEFNIPKIEEKQGSEKMAQSFDEEKAKDEKTRIENIFDDFYQKNSSLYEINTNELQRSDDSLDEPTEFPLVSEKQIPHHILTQIKEEKEL